MTNHAFACNLDALNPKQRDERAHLAKAVQFATTNVTETEDGYKLTLDANSPLGEGIHRFVELERRCCAFLEFRITQKDGMIELKISGPEGVKKFLSADFGLPESSR